MNQELLDDILLSQIEGIGSRTYYRLLEAFGSSTSILNASRSDLSRFDFHQKQTLELLLSARQERNVELILEICTKENIKILSFRDPNYPDQLRTIDDPPPLLYVKGFLLPEDAFSLAIVGTRQCSAYGRRQTERLSSALVGCGFTIISGLALGIDGVAHEATLKAGGRTVAVLGSGHKKLYPSSQEPLARRIVDSGGAVISEYPPLHYSAKWTFPQRNRIVSGLSLGTLVIEAPVRSGSMITARMAGEQGRDIFAVPGPIDSNNSRGCHALIRDGAYLVESVDDIVNVLGPMPKPVSIAAVSAPVRHPAETTLNEVEWEILQHLGSSPMSVQAIQESCQLEEHSVIAALSVLESKRIIRRNVKGEFVRI